MKIKRIKQITRKNSMIKNTICYLLILSLISGGIPQRSAMAESQKNDFNPDQVIGDSAEKEDSEEVAEQKLVQLAKEKPKLHSLGKYSVGFDDQQGFVPVEGLWGVGLSLVAPKMDEKTVVRANIGVYDMELQDVHFEHDQLKKDSSLYYVKRKEWVKENLERAKYTRDLPYEIIRNPKNNIDGYRIGFEFDQNGVMQTQYSYYLMCNKRMFHLKSHYLSSKSSSDGAALQKIALNFRCEVDGDKVGRFNRAEIRDNWKKANQTEEGQEAAIEALREFFIDYELSHDKNIDDEKDDLEAKLQKAKSLMEALLGNQKAYASDSANNCFYAGWVSEWAGSGNNMVCATPAGSKGCGEGQIKCNPAVFGNVCIPNDYLQQATQKCNSEYDRDKQKHFTEIKQHLKTNPSALGEVQKAADDLCDSKPYSDSNYSLCTSLYDRVSKIDPQGSPKRDEGDSPPGVDPENYREAYDSTQGLLQLIENHCMTPEGDMHSSVTVEGKHIDCVKAKETAMKNLKALDQVGADTNFSKLKGEACEYVDPTTPLKKAKEEFEKKNGPVCSKEELAKKKNCTNDFLCAAAASATFGIPIKVGKCDLHRDSCLMNAIGAILKSLWETVKGLASLAGKVIGGVVSDAWKATKNATKSVLNWFGASYKIDNASSYKCVQLAKSGGGMIANFIKDPTGSMKKFFNGIWTGINQWMMQDAFCQEWSGGAHISKCVKPSSGWECLSCKEKINGTCTIAGYLATELAAAFFTGGAATAVKMTGVGAKIVSMLSKGAKLGKLSRAKLVTKFPKMAKVGSVVEKGVKNSVKLGSKVLKATGKGTLWALNKLTGSVKSVYSRLANMKVVKLAAKPVKLGGQKGKKFLKWYGELNKKVYQAGKDLVAGLFKKPSKTSRAQARTELALNTQRRAEKVDDVADAGKKANQSESTANANSGKKTDSSEGSTNANSSNKANESESTANARLSNSEKSSSQNRSTASSEVDRPYYQDNSDYKVIENDIAISKKAADKLRSKSKLTAREQEKLKKFDERIASRSEELKNTPKKKFNDQARKDYTETSDKAENTLGRKLTDDEKDLIYRAHIEGRGAKGKNGGKAGVGNYTTSQLKEKMRILNGDANPSSKVKFTQDEIKKLMNDGVVGDDLASFTSPRNDAFIRQQVDGMKGFGEIKPIGNSGFHTGDVVSVPRSGGGRSKGIITGYDPSTGKAKVKWLDTDGTPLSKDVSLGSVERVDLDPISASRNAAQSGEITSPKNEAFIRQQVDGMKAYGEIKPIGNSGLHTGDVVSVPRSGGGRSKGIITGYDPSSGKAKVKWLDSDGTPMSKDVSLGNVERIDTGSVKWQQLSDDVDPTSYNSFRRAHDANDFSGDAKYISYWDEVRKERLSGKVLRKDGDGLTVERIDGKTIQLNSKEIQSVRNSTTNKNLFEDRFFDRRKSAIDIKDQDPQIVRNPKGQDWNRDDYISMRNQARESNQYFDQELWKKEVMEIDKTRFRSEFEKIVNESHKRSNYFKDGKQYVQNPGEIRFKGSLSNPTRASAVDYYNKLNNDHGIGKMVEGKLPIRGLNEKDWPGNLSGGTHFYPEGRSMHAYYDLGSDYLYDIRELIKKNQMAEAQNKIGHYYHVMLNARPYNNINNSLFANQANYLLKLSGHPGFSQGHLDHVMMRMSSDQVDRFWPKVLKGDVKNANDYGINDLR